MNDTYLCRAMQVSRLPKSVLYNQQNYPIEKCFWILTSKFNFKRTAPLNPHNFQTAAATINNIGTIRFPVLVSILGTNSNHQHVVVIWQNRIIDFESETTYLLTIANLHTPCGYNSYFKGIERGFGIIPSKDIKKQCKVTGHGYNWGEVDVTEELSHLFLVKKSRRF